MAAVATATEAATAAAAATDLPLLRAESAASALTSHEENSVIGIYTAGVESAWGHCFEEAARILWRK